MLVKSRYRIRVTSPRVIRFVVVMGTVTVTAVAPSALRAEVGRPAVHPIYARLQDAPQNDLGIQRFNLAARRFGLGPVEIVEIEGDPAPHPTEKLRTGIALARKLEFAAAQTALDEVALEVAATGGGGLDPVALSDLFVYRAWAISRADFNQEHVPAPTARAQGYADLLRAVALTPARKFNAQQYPPALLEDWTRAVAEEAARPQSTLVVQAAPEALVTCDGGTPVPGPATFVGLAQGEHLIHIDEPGWTAWGATISVNSPTVELRIPPRRALTLDDATAAAHARRMGTKFALVAEPRPGRDGGLSLALRLVDLSGVRRDAAIEPLAGDPGALEAAVMRLDEEARHLDGAGGAIPFPADPAAGAATDPTLPPAVLMTPPPARARLADDPGAWSRDHWPLLTAVGAMLLVTVVLSIGIASNR